MYNRLGEVKRQHECQKKIDYFGATLHPRDVDWLIEQAEKVATLEELLKQRLKFTEYEQVLKYYADKNNYQGVPSNIEQDNGLLARDVLEMKY